MHITRIAYFEQLFLQDGINLNIIFTEAHCYSMLHGSSGKNGNAHQNSLDDSSTPSGPYFDIANSKNVTALEGKTTYLNCRVKNLGNRTVSKQLKFSLSNVLASDIVHGSVRDERPPFDIKYL